MQVTAWGRETVRFLLSVLVPLGVGYFLRCSQPGGLLLRWSRGEINLTRY